MNSKKNKILIRSFRSKIKVYVQIARNHTTILRYKTNVTKKKRK
jgi:hypothetical protein